MSCDAGSLYEKVEDVASKDTVYSLFLTRCLVLKAGEVAQNHLSGVTLFLKYKRDESPIMLNQVKNVIIWREYTGRITGSKFLIIIAYYWFRQKQGSQTACR